MPEIVEGNLYDYPVYYDLVFGSDWQAEFHFLQQCCEHFANGRVQSLFEPACGTGRLMYRLAKAGYDVSGLDLNPKAVAYCNARLKRHGFPESAFVGDMSDFKLRRKVDVAFNMINSFRHLTTARQSEQHLQCVGQALRKGGLYVLGLHLTPTVGKPSDEESWSAQRGHLCVNSHMWIIHRDSRKRAERLGMTFDIYTPSRSFQLRDEFTFRTYTALQMSRLIDGSGMFEIAGLYDFAYEINDPIELAPEVEDVVFVLRRI